MSKKTEPQAIVNFGSIDAAWNATTEKPVKRRKRGRPEVKLTVEIGRTIVEAIGAGNFRTIACKLAGITPETLDRWLRRGDRGEQPYADFAEAYRRAEFECEAWHVENMRNQAPQDWRASKEFLARRFPERWSDHAGRLAVLGSDGTGAQVLGGFMINIVLNGEPGPAKPEPVSVEKIPIEDVKELPPANETRN